MSSIESLSSMGTSVFDGGRSSFTRDPLQELSRAAREQGAVTPVQLGRLRALLLKEPAMIEELLVKRRNDFIKGGHIRAQRRMLGNGLLVNEGEPWSRQRRLAQPVFHPGNLAPYVPVIIARTKKMLDEWHRHDHCEVAEEFRRLVIGIAAESVFGSAAASEAAEIGAQVESVASKFAENPGVIPEWIPLGTSARYAKVVRDLGVFVERVIQQRARTGAGKTDFFSVLAAARDESGSPMAPAQLRDELINLFVGGLDVSSLAVSWTFYLLASHPEIARRVYDEVDVVLHGRAPGFADYHRLTFLQMVLKESLRLYPPSWVIAREAIASTELGGMVIRQGTVVLASQWVMHRSERYFDKPDEFMPERWQTDRELPRFVYFPFGAGPRACIGAAFGTLESTLILAMIAQRFRFSMMSRAPIHPRPGSALRPGSSMDARLFPR